eukprot:5041179-Pleurochrysis_carterae.AAC.3
MDRFITLHGGAEDSDCDCSDIGRHKKNKEEMQYRCKIDRDCLHKVMENIELKRSISALHRAGSKCSCV